MASLTTGIHLSEPGAHLPSVGTMISVTKPNEQLLPEWGSPQGSAYNEKTFH